MKSFKNRFALLLCTLSAGIGRLGARKAVALANEVALINERGIESLQIDPSSALPISQRYLVYERGSSYNYGKVAGGVNVPLGISSDSPYAIGDTFNVHRFGSKPGFEIGVPGGAITQDHLVCVATDGSGKLLDLTTQGNGTYWVVGRCAKTVDATATEVAFVPKPPYQVNNNAGVWTFTGANV